MMKGVLFLSLFFIVLLSYKVQGQKKQFSSNLFHRGFIITTKQDTIFGDIKYNMETNILSVLKQGKLKTFSSQTVYYFEIQDEVVKNKRRFYAIPFLIDYNYKIPIFFELLKEGNMSLVCRESIVQKTVTNASPYWGTSYTSYPELEFSYYFLPKNGKLKYYNGKKKELYRLMAKKQTEIKKFISEQHLNTNKRDDLIDIIAYYNKLLNGK